ncbi:MAG: hypothetical protein ACR2FY_13675 [Pirellulaceae bacterium]
MQPDDEADELQALLREEYGAPPLDEQFSTDLIARLRAEAATSTPTFVPAKPRRSPLAICLAIATVAALVLVVIWISQSGTPATNYEVARRDEGKSDRSQHLDLSDSSPQSESARVDHLSVSPRSLSLSPESEVMPLSESLSDRIASESKHSHESLATQKKESLAAAERKPRELSPMAKLSVLSRDTAEWPNIAAAVALSDMLYVVDSGHLYEVSPQDGSRRNVGEADWRNTAAMGSAGGRLYVVCDNQLYEVNPETGVRRNVGKPEWATTKAMLTAGDKLYIASNGLLHRVNPSDGSHEVLHSKKESRNQPSQPKP